MRVTLEHPELDNIVQQYMSFKAQSYLSWRRMYIQDMRDKQIDAVVSISPEGRLLNLCTSKTKIYIQYRDIDSRLVEQHWYKQWPILPNTCVMETIGGV